MERTLLLVDDEENILASLSRALRRDGYGILKANSAKAGLELLKEHEVGVIISDQRMPEMTGTEFLHQVKKLYPNTVRMVLSGYTDLKTVTDAINEGAIYKFLTKPWEADLLRENVRKAFEHHELEKENKRLTLELKHANNMLEDINKDLERRVENKTRELMINIRNLQVSQEILENIPVAVIGINSNGNIAIANRFANQMFGSTKGLVGVRVDEAVPRELLDCFRFNANTPMEKYEVTLADGDTYEVICSQFGKEASLSGKIMVIINHLSEQVRLTGGAANG